MYRNTERKFRENDEAWHNERAFSDRASEKHGVMRKWVVCESFEVMILLKICIDVSTRSVFSFGFGLPQYGHEQRKTEPSTKHDIESTDPSHVNVQLHERFDNPGGISILMMMYPDAPSTSRGKHQIGFQTKGQERNRKLLGVRGTTSQDSRRPYNVIFANRPAGRDLHLVGRSRE